MSVETAGNGQRKSRLLPGGLLITLMTFSPTFAHAEPDRPEELVITGFSAHEPGLGWHVVNDDVMGGRSEGSFIAGPGSIRFEGRTNTDGGGFSSIRTGPVDLDLSTYSGIRLRIRGDGRRYTWRLTTDARRYGRPVAYWADFETPEDEQATIDIPFSRFVPRFRGTVLDGPAFDPGHVTGMGLMIYDGRDGPFELELTGIGAYGGPDPFSLERYRWQRRVLVVSAANESDADLVQMRQQLAATRARFADRDMFLVTLVDDGSSAAEDRALTPAEVAAVRAALDLQPHRFALRLVGKDGTVKFASDAATPIAKIYDRIDSMPMRRREMQAD